MKPSLVLPAAGLGKRMRSVNSELPKELLPLGDVPVIHYAFEEAVNANIRDVILIIGPHKEILRRYIEDDKTRLTIAKNHKRATQIIRSLNFHFLYQAEPTGESDAILLAESITDDKPVAIIYPDNVHLPYARALSLLVQTYMTHKRDVIGLSRVPEFLSPGIGNAGRVKIEKVDNNLYRILDFLPKGKGHFIPKYPDEFRACGFSIVGAHIYQYIRKAKQQHTSGEFVDVPVKKLLVKEKTVLGVPLPGLVFDVGNPEGYRLCLEYIQSLKK